jgi:hypothetical protein
MRAFSFAVTSTGLSSQVRELEGKGGVQDRGSGGMPAFDGKGNLVDEAAKDLESLGLMCVIQLQESSCLQLSYSDDGMQEIVQEEHA